MATFARGRRCVLERRVAMLTAEEYRQADARPPAEGRAVRGAVEGALLTDAEVERGAVEPRSASRTAYGKPAAQIVASPDRSDTRKAEGRVELRRRCVMDGNAILVAEGVRKVYRSGAEDVVALHGLDLEVPRGQFVAVMGPSGSGKTTLLNCLSGLDEIDRGRVLVDGKSIHDLSDAERTRHRAAEMGFVFQAFNLIPVFTATENVELPLLLVGIAEREARRRAAETLKRVGLGHRLDRRPTELSGGEQQRVAVARALAGTPNLVWADEPTGNLDSEMAHAVMELLAELHAEGLSIVLVTHDRTVASYADRLLTVRDGRLVGDELLGSALEPELVTAG
jgi:putative ABC transport system ATP-binding protein